MRTIAFALAAALAAVQFAAAADTDRVRIGGSSTTREFSPRTSLVVTSPETYVRTSFDGDHGTWRGPKCAVPSNPSLSRDVAIAWSVGFSNRHRGAEDAALAARTHANLPIVERGDVKLPHRIRGKDVGSIRAEYVVAATLEEYGWAELGLGIPLTRGLFAVGRFWSNGPSFACTVGTTVAKQWHRDAVAAALARVVVDGNLPAARLTAYGQRRRVVGFASDGFGHPVVAVQVAIERLDRGRWRRVGSARTDPGGRYLTATLPGTVRVTLGSLRSARVRIR